MNINFHYFAVKVLAVQAGFNDDDADTIAKYSQFVDDFNLVSDGNYEYVPDFAQYLAEKTDKGWIFHHVTTGFGSINDFKNEPWLLDPKHQREIVIPFHFLTAKDIKNIDNSDRRNYRVTPFHWGDTCILQDLLIKAGDEYIKTMNKNCLIRIGALLHTFADTYAHQRFSGFTGWENSSELISVTDNNSNKDITDNYDPNRYKIAPSLGHANISTAPDHTFVSFSMKQKQSDTDQNYQDPYFRNNTEEFLEVSRQILNYLLSIRNMDIIDDPTWNAFEPNLKTGLLLSCKKTEELETKWNKIKGFENINFSYDKTNLFYRNNTPSPNDNDPFFYFNVFADERRKIIDTVDFSTSKES